MVRQFSKFSSNQKEIVPLHSSWWFSGNVTGTIILLSLAWTLLSCSPSEKHSDRSTGKPSGTSGLLSSSVNPAIASESVTTKLPQHASLFEDEDYAVYSAVIEAIPARVTGSPILVSNVIAKYPFIGETPAKVMAINKPLFKTVQDSTLLNFASKSSIPGERLLQERFKLKRRYVLLDRPFEGLPRGIVYRRDRACILLGLNKGAKVFLSFSSIGFNSARTQAFLTYDISNGEGGTIFSILLGKQNGKWIAVNEVARATS